jgi:hypothetical protein
MNPVAQPELMQRVPEGQFSSRVSTGH